MQEIQQRIIYEIQQIPESRLVVLYDFIHYFRLGLTKEVAISREPGLLQGKVGAAFFEPLPEDELQVWE